ncbi:sentrin-specific protease 7 isoform X2 [Terrapene carolina triunguis]|uniref:sentrin-specific protease 7 isoform X2 n=1 Tax=Terrapene triunguis TaxID=2587831 RepID=UPI000E77D11A|nr:sentrin-specific protease 7 isoform X2 [Terrapene carolina triunguis]
MEGNGKTAASGHPKFRIPKKKPNTKSEDVHVQSPLSRLTDSHQWDCPLQEWKLRARNQEPYPKWKRQRDFDRPSFIDEGSTIGQPKVMLTNVLRTEIGRKYTQSQLITDANLSDVDKLQSDRPPSSSVASLELLQILNPPLQSLFISKRQPKVILKNVLRMKIGRKYIKRPLITDANLSDADKLLSGQPPSSSVANLQTCHILSPPHQSPFISKRNEWRQKKTDDSLLKLSEPSKEAESNNALFTVKRYDQQKKENKESDQQDKESKILNYTSFGLREASCLNSDKRKRRFSGHFPDPCNASSPGKVPSSYKERRIISTQSHRSDLIQENISLVVEAACKETAIHDHLEPALSCAKEHCSEAPPRSSLQKQYSATSEDVRISPLVGTAGKPKVDMSEYLSKLRNRICKGNQSFVSAEPIVLSSDDEGSSEPKDPEKLDLQPVYDDTTDNKETEQEPELPLAEELLQDVTEDEEQLCISTEPLEDNSSIDLPSCNTSSIQMGPALDIKITTLYIGNIKGTSTGCVTFTTRYIKIPFQVAPNKNIELSVDTIHLRKFGLWRNNEDCHSSRSSTFIFLWLSADYVEKIETQLEKSVLSKPSKSSEFVFLELVQPLTEREQIKLNEMIAEVSKKNRSPDLSDFLSWKQALPLFKDLSPEESSFMNCCQASFQQQMQKDSAPVLVNPLPQQEPKANVTKPSYALLQKQNGGCYSIALSCKSDDEWKEIRETGPVQNLIVYPAPPTKGGLGVTREDLECLEYGEFLNDVIIDFYLKYLLLEKAPKQLAERSHIFSSFFYKCLTRTGKNSEEDPKLSVAQRRHKRVRTWTRHINIFNKDYIFVPVNEESHWYIAVICFPWLEEVVYEDCPNQGSLWSQTQQSPLQSEKKRETVRTNTVLVFNDNWKNKEELDVKSNLHSEGKDHHASSPNLESNHYESSLSNSKLKKLCKRPCILILDSLKAGSLQNTVQILREYLEIEWEAKRKTHREFSKSTMMDFCPRVPKQDNSSDCGVYLLQYVETFFQDPVVNFELPMQLERWFPRRVVRSKREEIRDLILQLHLQQQSGSSS